MCKFLAILILPARCDGKKKSKIAIRNVTEVFHSIYKSSWQMNAMLVF